ncbi:MAG: Xaa-Pro aminopeptidase [Gammaproteobacteria bacterium]|nr:Xaa-Pro aminopeptidase [Gammaproteobacteria bacterium]NNF60074.1 Xaa-Pro aminopeptidase [Gammaproteobacteria bacterium]NNM21153.1 Xaa-Pro aminopeptidase [Gammaproteobacteria bacterium]
MNGKEFPRRRKQLMHMMGEGAIAILPAAPVRLRNRDVEHDYRPDSDFYYLSGFAETEAVAVLMPGNDPEYVLFCRERDPEKEAWDGDRAGPEGAVEAYGADDAYPITDIDDILVGMLEKCERVYYTMGAHPDFDQKLIGWINQLRASGQRGGHAPEELIALEHHLHELRLYKSRAEIAAMRKAAKIAAAAHKRAMQATRPGLYEYSIEAEYLHEFRRNGAVCSYPPIVGSGANACVLHYRANNKKMEDGEMLLVDAGCEYDYYASDITRSWPVNGSFTKPQREIYQIVLDAQQAAIEQVRAGNHWNDPHEAAVKTITRGLLKIGLLKGTPAKLVKDGAYKKFFFHRTGHWIGMDVHDVGDYKVDEQWRLLEPGMVMTVEPGIYIAPGTKGVPKRYQGIGVRIEDDVLVTKKGPDVLSSGVPSDPDEVEALAAQNQRRR